MKLKLSAHVWVQLTPEGKTHLEAHYSRIARDATPTLPYSGDWYHFTLAHLMAIFGDYVHVGARHVFVDDEIRTRRP